MPVTPKHKLMNLKFGNIKFEISNCQLRYSKAMSYQYIFRYSNIPITVGKVRISIHVNSIGIYLLVYLFGLNSSNAVQMHEVSHNQMPIWELQMVSGHKQDRKDHLL